MLIKSSVSLIMEQIKLEHLELFALEFGKIAETDFVYTLESPNINQSAPNLVKMYVTMRPRMSLIMDVIGAELSWVICPWICKNCWIWLCLHSSIYKCRPMSTKHGHNIYDNEILDEFNYWSNPTVTSGVICPWIRKNCLIWLCLHSSIYKCRPMSTKHGHNIYDNEILDEFNYWSNPTVTSGVICPWIRKNCLIWLCLHSSIYK